MATPSSPSNVFLSQGSGQVFIQWDLTATALSYTVQRSTDGVTFTTLASPAINSYLDTTVAVGTKYFYQVAAVNGSGTSAYTASNPQSIVPTLSGQLSLGEMRLRAQQRADMVNNPFVTTPEWNFFVNQAAYELYDMLITVYEDYYVAPRLTILADGASQSYPLPNGANYTGAPAFYKAYGVDLGLNTGQNGYVTLKRYNFSERNKYVFPNQTTSIAGAAGIQYRILGGNISFIPIPAAQQPIGLWYFPRLTTLLQDTDILDGISGWTEYIIIRAAKYALDEQEDDTSSLTEELAALASRITVAASDRDAGEPQTISRVRNLSNGDMGDYGGYSRGGGWY